MEARFYDKLSNGAVKCALCPHGCFLRNGESGLCGVRENRAGKLYAESYGRVTAMALDPIEKKPLGMFLPGSLIMSVSAYGCNFTCPFCQNHHISRVSKDIDYKEYTPRDMAQAAKELKARGNIGIAYTYNEPVTFYEYAADTAKLLRKAGMKNVVVTNGYINPEPLASWLQYIDALAIDLKSIREDFYKEAGGSLSPVLRTIQTAHEAGAHVEVINLIIAGENDSDEEMDKLSGWLGSVSQDVPLHLTRFRPSYRYTDREATPRSVTERLAARAKRNLRRVFY
ncbi:MAG: AmmeMemoRadiSam system radical SAM enzyme [Defluviitaleaceae bacterium]|nr:AmmeMemoRadiSam system radical SAM enzyme [Defluviitaleaceae bacterium]MCL2836251.1 AmmeMemoRadiSam system radical SAM enzyme [Defluviitaleaceae bacterium]